ncbi:hypothetical protein ACWGOQ_0005990 [Aquimarina sp. M1]
MNSKLTLIVRILLFVFGSSKFIGFLPDFEFSNPDTGALFGALANSYILENG